jgi:hypothetical protein
MPTETEILDEMLQLQMQQDYEKWMELIKQRKAQQQQSGGMNMPNMNILDSILGGGESGSMIGGTGDPSSYSAGGAGAGGYIAAAIALQQLLGKSNNRKVDNQKSGTVFDYFTSGGEKLPSVATEPWLGYAYNKLGWEPTEGEKFDAAVKNKDWGKAAERAIPAADYWFGGTPLDSMGYDFLENEVGKGTGKFLLPQRWLARDIVPKIIKKIF